MFTDKDLRELAHFKVSNPVLSLYLNTEPSKGNADAYKLRMRSMIKDIDLPKDVEIVERYFDHEYDWSGRSVVVFSCAPASFLKALPLALPVEDSLSVAERPAIEPLARLLENYGSYGIALVDQQTARLYLFHLGELSEEINILGEPIKKVKAGGGSTFPGRRSGPHGDRQQRDVDETIDRNFSETVELAVKFFEEYKIRRIIIGGSEENATRFISKLPKHLQSLVMGVFPIGMPASHLEVQEKAMQICQDAEMKQDARLVESLVTFAAKGNEAVIGLEKTLAAVNGSRVKTLVVQSGYHEPGYTCPDCSFLTTYPDEICLSCSKPVVPTKDVVELAVNHVIRAGGETKFISSEVFISQDNKIGAFLRY